MHNLAAYFDHTQLDPAASSEQIRQLCVEAKAYGFFSVCVHPCHVPFAKLQLEGSTVHITTVIGFPHGQNVSTVKAYETAQAIKQGADEIDMVINYGFLREGRLEEVLQDIEAVRTECKTHTLKVILETSQLSDEQIITACELSAQAGADFVKTSTGFRGAGATAEHVQLMRQHFPGEVKASGGIRTYEDALCMIEAGATRIGASASVQICMRNSENVSDY